MAFLYDATYKSEDVISLVDSVAAHWKKPASEVPDFVDSKLFDALQRVCEGCLATEKYTEVDRKLLALLALASATSWFTEAQLKKFDKWADKIAFCEEDGESEEEEDDDDDDEDNESEGNHNEWKDAFPDELVIAAIKKALSASDVAEVTREGKTISANYVGGDFGKGVHDGRVLISRGYIRIYDERKSDGEHLITSFDLPADAKTLDKCLSSDAWDRAWDDDDDDDEDSGDEDDDEDDDADSDDCVWTDAFPENDLSAAVQKGLKAAKVTKVEKTRKAISIEYEGGDYGKGKHDGSVYITFDSVQIYDSRKKHGEHLLWCGDFPVHSKDLEQYLASDNWEKAWDEDEWDDEDEGDYPPPKEAWKDDKAGAWMDVFSEDDLRTAVQKGLNAAKVTKVEKTSKAISVEYEGGDCGKGKHDGSVHITYDYIQIYDWRKKNGEHLFWCGDFPTAGKDLVSCFESEEWEKGWD